MRTFEQATRVLGALEERLMAILWNDGALSVREVCGRMGGGAPAYTTVMTTLDRLFKKGLLARDKDGNAFVYRPAMTRDAYQRRVVEAAVSQLMADSADPVLAAFVDVAAGMDRKNLERMERLIAERRRSRK